MHELVDDADETPETRSTALVAFHDNWRERSRRGVPSQPHAPIILVAFLGRIDVQKLTLHGIIEEEPASWTAESKRDRGLKPQTVSASCSKPDPNSAKSKTIEGCCAMFSPNLKAGRGMPNSPPHHRTVSPRS